jgi:hypothetical protein
MYFPEFPNTCLHCCEAHHMASLVDHQWTEDAGRPAHIRYLTRYGRLQKQKETSGA